MVTRSPALQVAHPSSALVTIKATSPQKMAPRIDSFRHPQDSGFNLAMPSNNTPNTVSITRLASKVVLISPHENRSMGSSQCWGKTTKLTNVVRAI
ncbi:MAG: hypothetical protein R3B96_18525 [Pirellulaceae bacterium]